MLANFLGGGIARQLPYPTERGDLLAQAELSGDPGR